MTQKTTGALRAYKNVRKNKPLEKRQLQFETLEEKAAPSGSLLGMAAMAGAASYSNSSYDNYSQAEYSSLAAQQQSPSEVKIDLALQFDPEWDVLESRALDHIFSDWDALGEDENGGGSSGATAITSVAASFSNTNDASLGEDDFTPLAEASLRAASTPLVTENPGTTASVFSATNFLNRLETSGPIPSASDLTFTPREHGNIYSAVFEPLQDEAEGENVTPMLAPQSGGGDSGGGDSGGGDSGGGDDSGGNNGGQVELPVASIQVISENPEDCSILESDGYPSGGSTNAGSGGEDEDDDEGAYLEFAITLTSEDYHNGSDVIFRVETGEGMADASDYRLEDGNGAPLQNYLNGFCSFPISGGTSALFRMVPENDSKLEGDEKVVITLISYEELPPDIFSGGHYAYKVEENASSATMTILDDEQLVLEKVVFDGQLDMIADPGTSYWDTSLHWKRDDLSKTVPVAYANSAASTNYLKAEGFFSIVSDSGQPGTLDLGGDDDVEIRFKAEGLSATSDWQSAYYSAGDQILRSTILSSEDTIREIYGTQQADYIAALELHWQFRVNEGEIKDATGHSVNPFYVTFDTPIGGTLYHTVVHTGCVAAEGKTLLSGPSPVPGDEAWRYRPVFNAIWEEFEGLQMKCYMVENGAVVPQKQVKRDENGDEVKDENGDSVMEDVILTYYGEKLEGEEEKIETRKKMAVEYIGDTPQLNPQLTEATIARQKGAGTTRLLLQHKDGTCSAWGGFMVDVLGAQGLAASTRVIVTMNQALHSNLKVDESMKGQGNVVPNENFWRDHVVVEYAGSIYDPSYGKEYGITANSLQNFSQFVVSLGRTPRVTPSATNGWFGGKYVANRNSVTAADLTWSNQ